MPRFAVFGYEELEFQLPLFVGDRIAQHDSVLRIPEGHGVEESFGIRVGELQIPVLASVGGVIDAGLVAGSGRHEEGFVGGEGDYGAEVEIGGVGNLCRSPGDAGVRGAEIGAVRAAGPADLA